MPKKTSVEKSATLRYNEIRLLCLKEKRTTQYETCFKYKRTHFCCSLLL